MSFGGGFGGFGSSTNNNTGFGASNTGTGFGASNNTSTSGGLFGGNTATSGGFGANNSTTGGFGGFGANKTGFGTSTTSSGGSMFGNTTATSGGGFGFGANNANTNTGFGASNTASGGLFGQNKPASTFGASNTSGSLFGNTPNTNTGFGAGNTSGGFGASTTNNPFSSTTNTNANTGGGFGGFGGGAAAATTNTGTAQTPFQAWSEKDGTSGNARSEYQSITFQQPYSQKSFEELRTEDYAQGRRYGNSNGQAGSFGQSTGFGGFGANNSTSGTTTGGFGATTSNTGGMFGNNNQPSSTSTGFGGFGANNTNNTSGGLFGAKPATGGLFGTPASTSAASTGGFGSTANAGGLFGGGSGFGQNNATNNTASAFGGGNTNTGGGLFGNQNNQNKTGAFGGFGGNNANTNTTSSLFGGGANNQPASTGGAFGGFSNTNNQSNTGGGLFGGSNANQPNNAGGGLFGNQNKTATGGGLFGNTNTNTTGGLFGNNNQQQNNGGSLFGNQQKTPATTGGLFGNNNANTGSSLFGNNQSNTGGGLFGGQNQQSNTGGGLFGSSTNNNNNTSSLFAPKPTGQTGGMFGSSTNNTSGGGLFGGLGQNNNQQNQQQPQQNNLFGGGSSLFGGNNQQNQQQPQQSSLFGGSFGANNSQQNQQTPQQQGLTASLLQNPYGNDQLFASLASPTPPVGPLATPLNGAKAPARKTPSLLASTRLTTPTLNRGSSLGRTTGYGFSYSTYGTPGSAFSGSLTPASSSLLRPTGSLGSALTSRLNKSFSTSNLRGDGGPDEGRGLLRSGALTPSGNTPNRYGAGSVRQLKIDRSLRTDLFGPPTPREIDAAKEQDAHPLRKRVSFDNSAEKGKENATPEPSKENALVRTETPDTVGPEPTSEELGLLRAAPGSKPQSNGNKAPEMEQVNGSGSGLASVPEDSEPTRPSSAPATRKPADKHRQADPGLYWMQPNLKMLRNMSRAQLQKIGKFTVGRENVGRIEFGPCDLTSVDLDKVCNDIVRLKPRSATVYEDDANKPAMGKGLNVPSTIYLENSWPRSAGGRNPVHEKSGRLYDKHIERLKRVGGTTFKSYDPETGVWGFTVQHFTTYGLDDDDDESEFVDDSRVEMHESSELSDAPATPTQDAHSVQEDDTNESMETGDGEPDDTFEFKRPLNLSRHSIPGGFDREQPADEEYEESHDEQIMSGGLGEVDMEDPFTYSGGAVQAPSPGAMDRYHSSLMEEDTEQQEIDPEEIEKDIPGSFAAVQEPKFPRSILKQSTFGFASPEKFAEQTWEEKLQQTMSPKKRDRAALRDMAERGNVPAAQNRPLKKSLLGQSAMGQSSFGDSYLAQKSAKKSTIGTNPEFEKSQAFKTSMDIMNSLWAEKTGNPRKSGGKGFELPYSKRPRLSSTELSEQDAAFHDSFKPSFTADGALVYSSTGPLPGDMANALQPLVTEHRDVRFAKLASTADVDSKPLSRQQELTAVGQDKNGTPFADTAPELLFRDLAQSVQDLNGLTNQERRIWQLCSILFDDVSVSCADFAEGLSPDQVAEYEPRIRYDAFAAFLSELVAPVVTQGLKNVRSAEEKALLYLTKNDVVAACEILIEAKDFKLATMVAQLPGTHTSRAMMKKQIEAWRQRNDWSEMSEPVRALYTVLAGETCCVEGKTGTVENRASAFNIGEAFDLSWQQSLGLVVFFGGHEGLAEAIKAYTGDIAGDQTPDSQMPTPWWHKGDWAGVQDTLVDILCAYAQEDVDVEMLLEPQTVSGSAVDSRLAWQLATVLASKQLVDVAEETTDRLTAAFASELEGTANFEAAIWVTLHLSDSSARAAAIASILDRSAGKIPGPAFDGDVGIFEYLTSQLLVPERWVWRAKALYAKAVLKDAVLQTRWLLHARDVPEAQQVLCRTVGPQAVIERDYEALQQVLVDFGVKGRHFASWKTGGQLYADFVKIATAQHVSNDMVTVLDRLQNGLRAAENEGRKRTLEERVALVEMQRVVADAMRELDSESRTGADNESVSVLDGMSMLQGYRNALMA